MERQAVIGRLRDLKREFLGLLAEAEEALQDYPETLCRAQAHWLSSIQWALDQDYGYLNDSLVTLEDTIEELAKHENPPAGVSGTPPLPS